MKLTSCLTALALVWAAAASTEAAKAEAMKAEVIHWWTSGGESAAVKVFADQFTKAGGVWIDSAVAGGVNARTAPSENVEVPASLEHARPSRPPPAMRGGNYKAWAPLLIRG